MCIESVEKVLGMKFITFIDLAIERYTNVAETGDITKYRMNIFILHEKYSHLFSIFYNELHLQMLDFLCFRL